MNPRTRTMNSEHNLMNPMNVHEPHEPTQFYVLLLSSSVSYLFTSEIQQLPGGVFRDSQ